MFPPQSPSRSDYDGLPDPPTLISLANAKLKLNHHVNDLAKLNDRINMAEANLAQIVLEAQCAINEMAKERSAMEDQILFTRSYLSPIRRLPSELLSYVFNWCFEEHPCCAWVLSAVCRKWRRLALNMPKMWSKVPSFLSIFLSKCENNPRMLDIVLPFSNVLNVFGFFS